MALLSCSLCVCPTVTFSATGWVAGWIGALLPIQQTFAFLLCAGHFLDVGCCEVCSCRLHGLGQRAHIDRKIAAMNVPGAWLGAAESSRGVRLAGAG